MAYAYPFSAGARQFLEKAGFESVSYEDLERAQSFVSSLFNAGLPQIKSRASSAPEKTDLLNYVLARMMLASLGSDYYSRRFSNQYGRVGAERLKNDSPQAFEKISKEFFPSLDRGPDGYSLSLPDFLKHGRGLPNTELESGKIFLSREQFFVLLHDAISQKTADFSSFKTRSLPPLIKEAADELYHSLPSPITTSSFAGTYLDLPCIRNILNGLPEGKRYYGSMALSVACFKDGLSKERAEEVLQQYVNACRRTSHPFTLREAFATLDWVYRHGVKGISCRTLREQGLAGPDDEFCAKCSLREGRIRAYGKGEAKKTKRPVQTSEKS